MPLSGGKFFQSYLSLNEPDRIFAKDESIIMNLHFKSVLFSFALFTMVWAGGAVSQTLDELEQYDLRTYSPVNYGLKDLVFEVRVSNLLDLIKNEMAITDVVDVYYKVYWMFPGQYKIEVEGLPKGFQELRAELRELIKERLEFVIPTPLANKLRSFSLAYKERKPQTIIEGVDETHTRDTNRLTLIFESNGKLKEFHSYSPVGISKSFFETSVKPWSHNKWVYDSLVIENTQGQQKNTIRHRFSYETISGVGFPEKIEVESTFEIIVPEDFKGEKPQTTKKTEILFSNFEVNTGKAQRYMTQGSSKQ